MMNLNHPFSDPGLASPDAPDVMPTKVYRVVVRVTVEPDWPADPNPHGIEETYQYAAYEAAREVLNSNSADWYAEEEEF